MNIFFDGFADLLQIAISVIILYISVIFYIRIFGKRSTSKMNNFDWIVTVAVGSLVASGILLEDITIAESSLAILMLLLCQFITTWIVARNTKVKKLVKACPVLLVSQGNFLEKPMLKERISKDEILSAIRNKGFASIDDIDLVILENNAKLSVIPKQKTNSNQEHSALTDVKTN